MHKSFAAEQVDEILKIVEGTEDDAVLSTPGHRIQVRKTLAKEARENLIRSFCERNAGNKICVVIPPPESRERLERLGSYLKDAPGGK